MGSPVGLRSRTDNMIQNEDAAMTDRNHKVGVVHSYVDGFGRGDHAALAALYAKNATVEDPAGGPIIQGIEAIAKFYEASVATGAQLKLEGPIRVAGDVAAFAFSVHLHHQGSPMRIDVIDTFRFDADGKILEMRAHWDQSNMHIESDDGVSK